VILPLENHKERDEQPSANCDDSPCCVDSVRLAPMIVQERLLPVFVVVVHSSFPFDAMTQDMTRIAAKSMIAIIVKLMALPVPLPIGCTRGRRGMEHTKNARPSYAHRSIGKHGFLRRAWNTSSRQRIRDMTPCLCSRLNLSIRPSAIFVMRKRVNVGTIVQGLSRCPSSVLRVQDRELNIPIGHDPFPVSFCCKKFSH